MTYFRPKPVTNHQLPSSQLKAIKSPVTAKPKNRWWRAMDHLVTSDSQKKGLSDGPLTRALTTILQKQNQHQQQHFNVNAIVSKYEDQSEGGITNTVIDISDDDSSVSKSTQHFSAQSNYNFIHNNSNLLSISSIPVPQTSHASLDYQAMEHMRPINRQPSSNSTFTPK